MKSDELLKISKPSRYMGGEINAPAKDLSRVKVKFALAFPDVYEVGMSHLGVQILYHILNQNPEIACERVFAPWPDMEKLLRENGSPLSSLESGLPLGQFDLLGFSLQYELNYTGILNMLSLAGIPLRAQARGPGHPLVVGGGPCALNPEPLADFFDLFVLGDGEEAVLELSRQVILSREAGETKTALLERLSGLEGFYVPSFFRPEYDPDGRIRQVTPLKEGCPAVRRRILDDLDRGPFPSRPVLPFMEVIHDRLNIEIARGCTRGCRFCQAGMIYRPLRERSPRSVLGLVKSGLEATGYDEVSLLSLSTGDYSCIEPLLASILEETAGERVAVSLPSLRVETLTPGLIERIREVRKTGFTLAPEAGTERLRRVINKGNTEDDLLSTIHRVFSAGWRLVKLYFMIGLPTEREEDLRGIASLCRKALQAARRSKGSAQINVSVSTFIPKAHTPFQWEPQIPAEEVARRHRLLRQGLDRSGLQLKWSDPGLSLLEGVFARGDRRLGRVLEAAYALGCRLDGWGEHFRYERWEEAFLQTGTDPSFYLRERGEEETLPWDHLASRVTKSFLLEERKKAVQGVQTRDCRGASCNGCGVCHSDYQIRNRTADRDEAPAQRPPARQAPQGGSLPVRRFRCRLAKLGAAKFLGHLEFSQVILRAFRRAGVPLVFSQGFHPLPRIAFGPPLPVGHESFAEYLDFQVQGKFRPEEAAARLNTLLPPGVKILEIQEIPLKSHSIFDSILHVTYTISLAEPASGAAGKISEWEGRKSFPALWARKGKEIDLKNFLDSISLVDERTFQARMASTPEGTLRPEEALDLLLGWTDSERPAVSVSKTRVIFKDSAPCPAKS